ncbi:MAG: E3 ubiquitin ligase family protein [Synechococcus sp.]
MGWLIAAGIALVVAAVLGYAFLRAKKRSDLMASTDTSTVEFLESMAVDMGTSPLAYLTEVKGKAVCDTPLISELSQTECVFYSMTVKREYEDIEYDSDAKGGSRRTTKTQTVSSNRRSVPFWVEDATGRIQIRPEGGQLVAEKVVNRYEPADVTQRGFKLGSFNFDVNLGGRPLGGPRTLGYRFEEEVIATNREVYVLGEATGHPNNLCMKKPAKGPMIVSAKSEEQLQLEMGKSGKIYLVVAGIFVILAAIFLVLSFRTTPD